MNISSFIIINVKKNSLIFATVILSLFFLLNACQENETPQSENIIKPPILKDAVEVYELGKFQEGYTLLAPMPSVNTYLIDMEGFVVNKWESIYPPNNSAYLLEDGTLLRTENLGTNEIFTAKGGKGGRLAKYSFEGDLKWSWDYSTDEYCQHHDIELLPNGNILVIAWEAKTEQEVLDAGKIPSFTNTKGVWPEHIVEVDLGGEIVWEWHQWDHMIQDIYANKDNFGNVAEHPELIDINFSQSTNMDITHINSVEYIEEHDLIILSAHHYSEIWIIDHSTTTLEAASHSGGKRDKGGDLVYRWGNPLAYKVGTVSDQISFLQHDPVWLGDSPSNGGNLTFFNNGKADLDRDFSTVDEILLPIDNSGNFELLPNVINGPTNVEWRFKQEDFSSPIISGAQRLENGNTLVCEGIKAILHEVTIDKETVWKYTVPIEVKSMIVRYIERPHLS